jgi:1,2-diacylglycerol 3-beta-galactosyltransferase
MSASKRVLIITADVGFGHRSAANAVASALMETYGDQVQVDIVNPLDDERTPAVLRDSQTDYDRMVRQMPDVYKFRYQLSDTPIPNTIMESAFTVMLYTIIQDILRRYRPDVIVTTHPMFPAPLHAVIATGKKNIPFLTVVTDLTSVHRMWFNDGAELIFVPTQDARDLALENHVPAEKIRITGIPVNPALLREARDAETIRGDLGWQTSMTTALLVGSKRVNHIHKVMHVLNHSGFPIQWILVAGGDDELYKWMQEQEWHGVTHLYNYVEHMPALLCAADLILSKAGGLIVTESLACGRPLLFIDVTPGQEEGNAEYVIRNGAGDWAKTPLKALEILCHWMVQDRKLLHERAQAARGLGRPRSAYTVAEFVWAAAERGPLPVPASRQSLLPKLLDLLGQFGLAGEGASAEDKPQLVS